MGIHIEICCLTLLSISKCFGLQALAILLHMPMTLIGQKEIKINVVKSSDGASTLNIMTIDIMPFRITVSINDTQHINNEMQHSL
jgi:hypothetical protein